LQRRRNWNYDCGIPARGQRDSQLSCHFRSGSFSVANKKRHLFKKRWRLIPACAFWPIRPNSSSSLTLLYFYITVKEKNLFSAMLGTHEEIKEDDYSDRSSEPQNDRQEKWIHR
jgi:hypothetical protein